MPQAGDLRDRVAFDEEVLTDDGYGNPISGYAEQFEAAARIRFLRGSEPVIAERLQGVQPVVITVRTSSNTRQVNPSWQIRDTRSATVFEIKSVTPSDDRAWIDLLTEVRR